MRKALVFGCCGFIGSSLSRYLRARGWHVTGADLFPPAGNAVDDFRFSGHDPSSLIRILRTRYDVCVNCAGAASVSQSYENPLRDYRLNTDFVMQLLTALRSQQPTCLLVNLSSAAVYGNPPRLPVPESEAPRPISPYGVHKHLAELLCREYRELFGLRTVSLRIFSAYGPGLKRQLFWDLFCKAQSHDCLELLGSGRETRDFIYVDDLVRAIELVMTADVSEYSCINVASGEETTIEEAARMFCSEFPLERRYRFTDRVRAGDPDRWVADIRLLRSLGFRPEVRLAEGIKQYIHWALREQRHKTPGIRTTAA